MQYVTVVRGMYRGNLIENVQFVHVRGPVQGKNATYVTVKNDGQINIDIEKIKIELESITDVTFSTEQRKEVVEDDNTAMNRIASRFEILHEMSRACIEGDVRAMIVCGPPGIGKSYGVITQLNDAQQKSSDMQFSILKGESSALGLYKTLYNHRTEKNVVLLDDVDDLLKDETGLNILKAALDTGVSRTVCWNTESRILRDEGIPNAFTFNGSVIVITNLNFSTVKGAKLTAHLSALQSRCHFLDLSIDTARDALLRIRQVHRDSDGGLFASYEFDEDTCNEILDFMYDNRNKLREVSIRCALKVADLVKLSKLNWRILAENTILKNR